MTVKNKKTLTITLCLALVVAIAAGGFLIYRNHRQTVIPGIAGVSEVNYNPPTKQEQASGNNQKPEVVKQQELDNNNVTNTKANLVITDATYYSDDNNVEVRAYVSNVFEDGGVCTATFTNGSQTVTQSNNAFKDATTTQCGALNIPRSKFPNAGTWKLSLTYSSDNAQGSGTGSVSL